MDWSPASSGRVVNETRPAGPAPRLRLPTTTETTTATSVSD